MATELGGYKVDDQSLRHLASINDARRGPTTVSLCVTASRNTGWLSCEDDDFDEVHPGACLPQPGLP
ncbi:hypothetical protein TUN199_11783, partial [Pyrenophora tritici-repentis]